MSDIICNGACNRTARRRHDDNERDLAAWQAAVDAWVEARKRGEDVGEAPQKPTPREIYWTAGDPIWCFTDQATIRAALTALDELMPLRLMYGDGYESSGSQEPVRGSKDPASPSPAHDDLDDLTGWLRDWENALRDTQGWPTAPYRGESAPALTTSIAWHLAHLDVMLAHPDLGADYGYEILAWHNRLDGAAKTRRRRIAKPVRCPQCHLATLSQLEGEDRVECRNSSCGDNRGGPLVWSLAEYEAYAEAVMPTPKQAREVFDGRREPKPHADYGTLSGRA